MMKKPPLNIPIIMWWLILQTGFIHSIYWKPIRLIAPYMQSNISQRRHLHKTQIAGVQRR